MVIGGYYLKYSLLLYSTAVFTLVILLQSKQKLSILDKRDEKNFSFSEGV